MVSHLRDGPGRVSVRIRRDGNLPAVAVSCFWTNHVESGLGVVKPHFGRQVHCSHSPFFSVFFNKHAKTRLSSVRLSLLLCVRQWSP